MHSALRVLLCSLGLGSVASAAILDIDFSTYADGNLVGQNGWTQFGASVTAPLQVSGGAVRIPGLSPAGNTDQQDAILPFSSLISPPDAGTTTLYLAFQVTVTAAGANPSYFGALSTLTSTETASNFANARIAARSNPDTSQLGFGARVTGQAGYPFAYGADRAFSTAYNVFAEINLVAGAQNDSIRLFVQPTNTTFDLSSVYATSVYGSGSATDPTFGGLILSQFASATTQQSEVAVFRALVTQDLAELEAFALGGAAIPEPSSYAALLGLAALTCGLHRRRRA
jgi:hypothetical protein